MKIVWNASGDPVLTLTPQQRKALEKVGERFPESVKGGTMKVHPIFDGSGAVMVQATSGLWLGVEKDGYTHS
jgi:hypothetical protein